MEQWKVQDVGKRRSVVSFHPHYRHQQRRNWFLSWLEYLRNIGVEPIAWRISTIGWVIPFFRIKIYCMVSICLRWYHQIHQYGCWLCNHRLGAISQINDTNTTTAADACGFTGRPPLIFYGRIMPCGAPESRKSRVWSIRLPLPTRAICPTRGACLR